MARAGVQPATFMKALKNTDTQKRILEVADRLFYVQGVRATRTAKITAIAEVAKAKFSALLRLELISSSCTSISATDHSGNTLPAKLPLVTYVKL